MCVFVFVCLCVCFVFFCTLFAVALVCYRSRAPMELASELQKMLGLLQRCLALPEVRSVLASLQFVFVVGLCCLDDDDDDDDDMFGFPAVRSLCVCSRKLAAASVLFLFGISSVVAQVGRSS